MYSLFQKSIKRSSLLQPLFHKPAKNNLIHKIKISSANTGNNQSKMFEQLGLKISDFDLPNKAQSSSANPNYIDTNPYDIKHMYDADLSSLPVFEQLINFGIWKNMRLDKLSKKTRERSSRQLYRYIGEESDIRQGKSVVLDVGCGPGFGTIQTMKEFKPAVMIGIDINKLQVNRANNNHKKYIDDVTVNRLQFIQSSAEHMPFKTGSVTHVISVEAAQHFTDLDQFFSEVARVLQSKKGKFVFTTFFPTLPNSFDLIKEIIPDASTHCSDIDIEKVKEMLSKHMDNVEIESIGEHVWYGLQCWLKNIGFERKWTSLWWYLYEAGHIDYYVIKAESFDKTDEQNINTDIDINETNEYDDDYHTPSLKM